MKRVARYICHWKPDFRLGRRLNLKVRLVLMGLAVLMPLLAQLLSHFPSVVETVYTLRAGRLIALGLARLTAFVPFSLMEFLLYAVLLRLAVMGVAGGYGIFRRWVTPWRAVSNGVLRTLTTAAVLTVLFYLNWGFNFALAGLPERLGWAPLLPAASAAEQADELAALSARLVDATNDEYLRIFGVGDLGVPSQAPPASEIDMAVEQGYAQATLLAHLPAYFGARRAPAKPVAGSFLLSRMLILGFYSPWTGEANYNRNMPGCKLPHTIAHEKAHQRLITNESEANFLGYLACASSDAPYVRYSAYLFAQRQLLTELLKVDKERGKDLIARRLPGVQRDVDDCNAWANSYSGRFGEATRAVNNIYLRANRVAEGIGSYQESAKLLLMFARENGIVVTF